MLDYSRILPFKPNNRTTKMVQLNTFAGFDSDGERYFSWYLDDLVKAGYLKSYKHHCETYRVIDPVNIFFTKKGVRKDTVVARSLLRCLEYSPDFLLVWNPSAADLFFINLDSSNYLQKKPAHFFAQHRIINGVTEIVSVVDVKSDYNDGLVSERFKEMSRVVFDKLGIFVNEIKPKKLFEGSFVPDRYLLTNVTLKPRSIEFDKVSLSEFVMRRKECLKR